MKNVLLTIEYDGTAFSGWQRQPGQRTVQGELERVLSYLCNQEITIAGTSRTDAGVHAYDQRATLRGDFGIPTERIAQAANNLLKGKGLHSIGDIRILNAVEMPSEFHARFDCVGKKYIYRIRNAREPDIMKRNYCYQVNSHLDLKAMKEAASYLEGEQDFKTFMAAGGKEMESTVRTIYKATFREEPFESNYIQKSKKLRSPGQMEDDRCDRWIFFEIIGNGFLYNMVRIIIGTLVDIGMGKISAKSMKEIIESLDRRNAGHTAPPQGLYLVEAYYDINQIMKETQPKEEN